MASREMAETKGTPEVPPSPDGANQKDLERLDVDPPATAAGPGQDTPMFKRLSWLDRLLALWIFLAMAVGIILGNFVPNTGPALQKGDFEGVSIPIAVGLLVMMYPILCKVRYETLHIVFRSRGIWVQILFSIVVNWVVAPLVMVTFLSRSSPRPEQIRRTM